MSTHVLRVNSCRVSGDVCHFEHLNDRTTIHMKTLNSSKIPIEHYSMPSFPKCLLNGRFWHHVREIVRPVTSVGRLASIFRSDLHAVSL